MHIKDSQDQKESRVEQFKKLEANRKQELAGEKSAKYECCTEIWQNSLIIIITKKRNVFTLLRNK
jgi:hypothetical protein